MADENWTPQIEEVIIGDDHDIEVIVVDKTNAPIDVSAQEIHFVLRRYAGQTAIVDKNTTDDAAYFDMTNAAAGKVTIQIPNADTSLLTSGRWIYVMKRVVGARTYTIGNFEIWAANDTDWRLRCCKRQMRPLRFRCRAASRH